MRFVTNEYSLFDEKGVLFVQCGFFCRIVGTGESDIFYRTSGEIDPLNEYYQ